MFTGLVEMLGTVRRVVDHSDGRELTVAAPLAAELVLGESVAVNGACLTVVEHDAETFRFQLGPETLKCTNLGQVREGDRVNLERSLRFGDRLGGHLVSGHVDAIGHLLERREHGEYQMIWISTPPHLSVQMVPKGSIAVDGISLTLVEVLLDRFSVMLIPHTLSITTLGFKNAGAAVNLETDLLAKYVQKLVLPPRG